jgi:1-acyl-sn-glycerol-3-phosphate acyltransferase
MFAAGLAAVSLVFPLGDIFLGPRRGARVRDFVQVAWYRMLLTVLGIRVRISGAPSDSAALWVSNHISWMDIVLLGSQKPVTFVAKSEVGRWPVVGYMARGTRTLLVRRGDPASSGQVSDAMTWLLRQQRRVAVFPEGTSSDGQSVLRFHSRLMTPAIRVGTQVQAIAIAYRGRSRAIAPFIGDDDFLPHLWRLLAEPCVDAELIFCPAVDAAKLARSELADHARAVIVAALAPPDACQKARSAGGTLA